MAKSRINKKQIGRLKQKQAYDQATQIRLLAEGLRTQEQLKTCLLQESDTKRRRMLYDFMAPFLKFKHEFPSTLVTSGIIIPGR